MKDNEKKLPIVPIAVVAVVLVFALILGTLLKKGNEDVSVAEGMKYLEALEQKDPAVVVQFRKDLHQQKLDAQRNELRRQVMEGKIDPFTMFQDFVLMGDSRVVGYWYRDFLDKGRVLADGGHTIRNITRQMDDIVALNPTTLYLCYGLNDISIGFWKTPEEYAAEYMQIIAQIKERLPDVTVVVGSILPAQDPAFERSSKWRKIPEWNVVLEQVCQENGILYANCDHLAVEYPDYWDQDGIHFRKELYPYWAKELILATLSEGVNYDE